MNGKLIVLEGLDGSGKATQARLLQQALEAGGRAVRRVTFPNYDSPSSALVKMYLGGSFGTHPGDVNAYAASMFFAVDRYAGFRSDWHTFYEQGGVIVCDRYTTSNAVFQCSKLPRQEWDPFLEWLFDLEYRKFGIPEPAAVIYLDMSPEVSQRLMSGRYHGREEEKDIHEKDLEYQARSREAGRYCAQKLGWRCVCCDDGVSPLTVEAIHARVLALASAVL